MKPTKHNTSNYDPFGLLNVPSLSPFLGFKTMEDYVRIRFNDLQRAQKRMDMLKANYQRKDCPMYWSKCRKALNQCKREWFEVSGRI